MLYFEHCRKYFNQQRWGWLMLGAVLVFGVFYAAYHALTYLPVTVPLTLCAISLAGYSFVLKRRLQYVRVQRDHALSQASAAEWQMCAGLKNQDPCMLKCAARRVGYLQAEIAILRARKQQLELQAHHDDLTGLANRVLLADRFQLTAERSKRSGESFGLLMIDLDKFKSINDHYGHAAGDLVLITSAQRLLGTVRASDTVARLGGDEFVVIIAPVNDPQELASIGRKLSHALSEPITLANGVPVRVGVSLGLALYPDDGGEMNDLLQVADQAMYECKSSGLMSVY